MRWEADQKQHWTRTKGKEGKRERELFPGFSDSSSLLPSGFILFSFLWLASLLSLSRLVWCLLFSHSFFPCVICVLASLQLFTIHQCRPGIFSYVSFSFLFFPVLSFIPLCFLSFSIDLSMQAWQLNTQMCTYKLRMQTQAANAELVANFLASHPRVLKVLYPSLLKPEDHDYPIYRLVVFACLFCLVALLLLILFLYSFCVLFFFFLSSLFVPLPMSSFFLSSSSFLCFFFYYFSFFLSFSSFWINHFLLILVW